MKFSRFIFVLLACALCAGLGACAVGDHTAFDLENDSTGRKDRKGFPVFVGPQYNRDVNLKGTVERAELESELQALADSRKDANVDFNARKSELLQQRLQQIARTHGARAQAEIDAACSTDDSGIVSCKGEADQ